MAYTRQYPNSITPNSSTVRDCLENDDKELKRVLGLISGVGGLMLSGTKRQCVLYGSTDSSGNPNFLTASGLNVSINGSSKPVILSFANGFSTTSGTLDTLDAITSAVSSAWTIPANSTYYLYIEKDMSTGLLSYGRTANEDTYSKAAPSSPVLDQCYFNTNEMKMYHYNGSAWEQKWRIFVAKAVSTNSAVTLTHYPMISRIPIEYEVNTAQMINNLDLSSYAELASPALTGIPTAPTAATENNNTQIATSAFVRAAIAAYAPQTGIVAASLAANGYVKFANGLILQWGYNNVPSSKSPTTVTLPISFSTSFLFGMASIEWEGEGAYETYHHIISLSLTNFKIDWSLPCKWVAIGY